MESQPHQLTDQPEDLAIHPEEPLEDIVPKESKVGKKLSDLTTKRVIVLVLAILFAVPVFSTSSYQADLPSYEYGLSLLMQYDYDTEEFDAMFSIFIEEQL